MCKNTLVVVGSFYSTNKKTLHIFGEFFVLRNAREETRTPTSFRTPAPKADASTYFATRANSEISFSIFICKMRDKN